MFELQVMCYMNVVNIKSNTAQQSVQRAPDAGDSAAISGSFLRLSLFPWTVRLGQAGWTASPSPATAQACALKGYIPYRDNGANR